MSRRPARMLIEDMLERIARIERFVAGVEREALLRDEKRQTPWCGTWS